ncbi:MAG: DUF1549 domain-containing protein, partial [Verrucomicrobiota bacterium]
MRIFLTSFLLLLIASSGWAQAEKPKFNPSQRIDQLVAKQLKAEGIQPNPIASDEVFVRRIYLDVIGRIPTRAESLEFLNATAKNKRALLVDELLNSEGYVSHHYNYWADILRAKT